MSMESVSYLDMFSSLSTALDLVNPRLGDHHKLTCYISSCIAKELGWDDDQYELLFGASLIHDLGASSSTDRLDILGFDCSSSHDHALIGEAIIESVAPMARLAPHVGDHHTLWNNGNGQSHQGREVSKISHLIQLADRVAVLIDRNSPLIIQAKSIRDKISRGVGKQFVPELAEAFCDIASRHSFWMHMDSIFLDTSITDLSAFKDKKLDLSELEEISRVYAFIIDSRSRFTANHSSGVATVAEALAEAHGLDRITSRMIKISGYLHDIGKLSVPEETLEKNGKLDDEERLIISGHSFYTRKILTRIKGLEQIGEWAGNHHEFIDGSGYPLGLKDEGLDVESRIITVADIFTALTEDRPYRKGMDLPSALGILENFAQRDQIDGAVLQSLEDNSTEIDGLRRHAQEIENRKMTHFWELVGDRIRERSIAIADMLKK